MAFVCYHTRLAAARKLPQVSIPWTAPHAARCCMSGWEHTLYTAPLTQPLDVMRGIACSSSGQALGVKYIAE